MKDIIIIGAGVIGCAIGRELSKYDLDILILEKENDVSQGASKANSGIVHGGYDAKHGTNKGYFSRKGNQLYDKLNKELNFGFERCGSLVLAFDKQEVNSLYKLKENGIKNGVNDLKIISKEEILKMEPHVNKDVKKALYCPSAGIASPYELTIALAENAISNGVNLKLKTEVISIEKNKDSFNVYTKNTDTLEKNTFNSKYVINCAGAYSDKISKMVGIDDFHIIPRRGEYIVLNKNQGYLANKVLFQAPSDKGKGILVTKTFHGNLMIGPNAQEMDDPSEIGTNLENLKYIVKKARKTVKDFDLKYTLRSFSGIRATSSKHDFIIGETNVDNFINVAGIESPGLTSSPAIAKHIKDIITKLEPNIKLDPDFDPTRKAIIVPKDENFDGEIDHENPEKNIICRCEKVTEAEIIDAINRGIPIDSLDAIKRRTRAGMGPCQGTFCGPRVKKLITKETGLDPEDISWRGKGSSSLPPREDRTFWKKL
ncbi:MAG: NAD(P)/FAD-dependent oxidoreductase [Bacillota bacterium]